jgi:hypothetical protein
VQNSKFSEFSRAVFSTVLLAALRQLVTGVVDLVKLERPDLTVTLVEIGDWCLGGRCWVNRC